MYALVAASAGWRSLRIRDRSRLTIASEGNDLRWPLGAFFAFMDCLLDVALAGGDDAEGDPGFGAAHLCVRRSPNGPQLRVV